MWIGIIGSAGRGSDGAKWTPRIYKNCFKYLDNVALADVPIADRQLVSGGASWADHLAVSLFLSGKAGGLDIHMPCQFHLDEEQNWMWSRKLSIPGYADTGVRDFKINPGGTLNYYHRLFSDKMQANTMAGIALAAYKGANLHVHYPMRVGDSPLHHRNLIVGRGLERLYAFTWGEDPTTPADGGTKHCWDHASGRKQHIPLHTMR